MPELVETTAAATNKSVEERAAALRRGTAIASLAMAAPPDVVDNAPIAARLGVEERWIVERTGVEERRIAADGERLPTYAAEAGAGAMEAAGIDAGELDLVLVATMSHEQLTPHAATLVATQIGASRAGALDVNAACTGFLSALSMATGQIESRRADTALVIGADLISRLTNRDDRSTAGLFGDGAGAMVLRPADPPGQIGPVVLGSDGARAPLIQADRSDGLIRMKGPDTFRQAVDRLAEATLDALAAAGRTLAEVDLFAYHQANSRIIRAVGERLELPADKVIDVVPRYGNTSAASIPIALVEAREEGQLPDGATVLCAAFGGGLAWGATVIEWGTDGG
jgi:3-oxoacyl-[acyl-carrier-protein] synthase III